MKRKNLRYRGMPLPRQFARPSSDSDNVRLSGDRALGSRAGVGGRKVFVVKQSRWLRPTHAARGQRVRRILIFDNHPDSLRLAASYRRANVTPNFSAQPDANSWQLFVAGMLAMGALVGMLWLVWPLF